MAELRNCIECGRLFAYSGRAICSKCVDKEEEDYTKVRRYVRDHPGASVFEVSEDTGVEEEKILRFLKDGRLQSKGLEMLLKCRGCGSSIMTGEYCYNCQVQLQGRLDAAIGKNRPPAREPDRGDERKSKDRMHIKDGNNRRVP